MASTGAALFVLLVLSSCAFASSTSVDGRPRPENFPDEPTVVYGAVPTLTDDNGVVPCGWFGFANMLYDAATTSGCLTVLRAALTNATVNPPANMKPYMYYTLKRLVDPANNQSYCYQGCFNLTTTAATAPAAGGAPPPVTFGVPPGSSASPGPSLFPGAPPPGTEAPLGSAVPPASIFAPPGAAPVATPVATPTALVSPVGSPGAFLQPTTAFISALVAFAAILVAA